MMSGNDKITKLLKKYADLEKAEHTEIYWKPPKQMRNNFMCCFCGKIKMCGNTVTVFFHRLDGTILIFCSKNCWASFLRKNHTVRWTENRKIHEFQKHPIEIEPDLFALSVEQKYAQYLERTRIKERERWRNYSPERKDELRARARERLRKKKHSSTSSENEKTESDSTKKA